MRLIHASHHWKRLTETAVIAALVSTACLATQGASAQEAALDEEARTYYNLAVAQYESGRFQESAESFLQAYRISERPELLYNLYLAYQDAGLDAKAAETLSLYLRLATGTVEDRAILEARLRVLEANVARDERIAAEQSAASERQRQLEENLARPGPNHALAWSLIGAGGATTVAGIITAILTSREQSHLESLCDSTRTCPPSAQESLDRSARLTVITDVLLTTGIAVAATGLALRLLLRPSDASAPDDSIVTSFMCAPDACIAETRLHF